MYSFKQSKLLAVVVMLMNLSAFAQTPAAPAAAPAATESSTTPLGVTTKDYARETGIQARKTEMLKRCNGFVDKYSENKSKVPAGCFDLINKCITNLDSSETGMMEGYMQAFGYGVAGQSILPTNGGDKVNCEYNVKDWRAENEKLLNKQRDNAKDRAALDKEESRYEEEYQNALKKIEESEMNLTKELKKIQDKQTEEERNAALESNKQMIDATKRERQLVEEMSNTRKKFNEIFNKKALLLENRSMDKISLICEEKIGFMISDFCSKNTTSPKCKKQTYGGLGSATSAGGKNVHNKKLMYNSCIRENTIMLNNSINENAEDLKAIQERLTTIAQDIDLNKKSQEAQMNNLNSSMQQLKASNQREYQMAQQEYQQLLQQRQRLEQMQMQKKFNLMKQRMEQGTFTFNTVTQRNQLGTPSQACGTLSVNEASVNIQQMLQQKENALKECCNVKVDPTDALPLLDNSTAICTGSLEDEISKVNKDNETFRKVLEKQGR